MRHTIKKIVSTLLITSTFMLPTVGMAASLTDISDVLSTLKTGITANHTIYFKTPTGATTGQTVILTFPPSGFNMSGLATTSIDFATSTGSGLCDVETYGEVTLGGASIAGVWGVATSSNTITFTAPTDSGITAGRCIRIEIGSNATNQHTGVKTIVNPAGGNYPIGITGSFTDTGTTTIPIIANDVVTLNGEVPQSVTFSISGNSASFGVLSASAARFASSTGAGDNATTSAHNLIAGTNASFGYSITATGTTMTSGANTITAVGAVRASSTIGTEQFGMAFTASGGTGVVDASYNATTSWAFNAASAVPFQIASATGSSANTTYLAYYIANIASNTEAGSYTTAITYVATANY